MQINRVLVPVDFSPPSAIAMNYAVQLARQFSAKLTLLHVIEPLTALTYAFPTESENAERQRYERAERMLAAMLGPEDQDDLDLETVVVIGDVGAEIESVAHQQHADVIVMGTHGRGLVRRWLIGSVTQALLRKIDIPILTVCHGRRPLSFKRIMFATDFSESADRGLDFALDLAKTLNAGLIVAHVVDKRPAVTYETPEIAAIFDAELRQSRLDTEARFKMVESRARTKNVKVQTVIAQGIPAEALVRVADENTVDFVVLAIGRKSRMDRILLGTTAEQLIREATIPVLSVPVHPVERSNHEVDKVSNAGTQANSPRS